jgi:RNA polymerase sigma-70 factor, ECF subfamily
MSSSAPELAWSEAQESALLERLRTGEEGAYETLVRGEGPRLLAVARRYSASEEDAQEAVQEAFLSAFKALPTFRGGARLSTWLHRIAVNAALMRARSRKRRRETQIEELLPRFTAGGHHAEAPVAWSEAADAGPEREEERELVRRAIDELPEGYRTLLLLRDIEGWENSAIAEHLGITPNAAKIRVHRARQALRTLLDPHFRGALS